MSKYLNDYDRSIHSNPDARAWAKFFMKTVKEQGWNIEHIDEGLMVGWFANAMMAMHDHVKREKTNLYTTPVHAIDMSQERVDETPKRKHEFECSRCGHCCQQKEWVGLTDAEVDEWTPEIHNVIRAIEAKLKEKNHE